jgi:hypothetical protein
VAEFQRISLSKEINAKIIREKCQISNLGPGPYLPSLVPE